MSRVEKKWQIMPKINNNFIDQNKEINNIVLQLLFNRGLTNKKDIELFLSADYSAGSYDPLLFKDMERAVDLIVGHIKSENKIVVYGDYDADGATSSAILVETLSTLKARVGVYIPDRVSEGYGLNKKAIDELISGGTKLIITVDNGIRNKEEIKYIKDKKVDVIVTDHHIAPDDKKDFPDCLIINPAVSQDNYPFRFLSGAGVAFKLAKAIIDKAKIDDATKKKIEESLLDLVAIGTIADCVILLGENRVLVKRGLEVLNKTKRIGLLKLIEAAKINNRKLDSWNVGFQIAPRLNAAGRMDHANTAFELLITRDEAEASLLAENLNSKNVGRQETTENILGQIISEVESGAKDDKIIVAVSKQEQQWNEGVIGLVAGKIAEKYYKPVLVITQTEDGYKGSGRSIDEFNIIEAIEQCADLFTKFGGHPAACGFSLLAGNLEKFVSKIKNIANEQMKNLDLKPAIEIEAELKLSQIDEKLMSDLDKFCPFGAGNDRPKFVSYNTTVVDIMNMGFDGQHIKLKIKNGSSNIFNAIGFGQTEKWKDLIIGDKIDIVYYLETNEFNGRSETQMKIVDIKNA